MRFFGAVLVLGSLVGCAASSTEDSASSAADITASVDTCTASTSARALMNDPMKDPDDAAARLGCLATVLTAQHDGRAVFATLYTAITKAVDAAIKSGTTFEDNAWTAKYLTEFAELYRVAFVAYVDGQGAIPGAWQIAFDAAKESKTLIVQDMTLGVTAHVDHDLANALYTIGIGAGETRAMHQRDHFRVNDILHANVEAALTTLANLYAPGLAEAPATVMTLLSDTYFKAVEAGRVGAWVNAVALTDTTSVLRDGVEDEIEDGSKVIADAILIPSIDPAIDAKLHAIERGQ